MNVKEIVEACIKAEGFDGLYTDHCGCFVGDLMVCESSLVISNCVGECKPGYKSKVKKGDYNNVEEGHEVGDFVCGPEKEIEKL